MEGTNSLCLRWLFSAEKYESLPHQHLQLKALCHSAYQGNYIKWGSVTVLEELSGNIWGQSGKAMWILGLSAALSEIDNIGLETSRIWFNSERESHLRSTQWIFAGHILRKRWSRATESLTHWGWKRLSRSLSPAFNWTQSCQLNHGTKCNIHLLNRRVSIVLNQTSPLGLKIGKLLC